jgi:hypothetical protein
MELLGPNAVRATATSLYVEIQSVEYGSAKGAAASPASQRTEMGQ